MDDGKDTGATEVAAAREAVARVAVLIATKGRSDLLAKRALASIEAQRRHPDYLVIVEDTRDPRRPATRGVVHRARLPGTRFLALRNERAPGAAGAWNTGIDHLLRVVDDPRRVWLALLDDDDRYERDHLERCFSRATKTDYDMVAAPMLRIEAAGERPRICKVPRVIKPAEFLVSSQHIQGSNLFVRLSTIVEAGLFDEGQTSVTDRDVMIRISELPGVRYRKLRHPSVIHHAERDRARMSSPRSRTRCQGLIEFHQKWRSRMTAEQEASSRRRASVLFGWMDPPGRHDPRPAREAVLRLPLPASPGSPEPVGSNDFLVVATTATAAGLPALEHLLLGLATRHPTLEAIVVEAGGARSDASEFARGVDAIGARLAPVSLQRIPRREGVSPRAVARAALAARLASVLERGRALGALLDAGLEPAAAVVARGGVVRAALPGEPVPAAGVAAGAITGLPALPPYTMLRTQLVDLHHNLHWLGRLDPGKPLPDRGLDNALSRRGRADAFDDATSTATDRLERPFWLEPAVPGETAREAFVRLATALPRLLAGDPVFRHAVFDPFATEVSRRSLASLWTRVPAALAALPLLGRCPPGIAAARQDAIEVALARAIGVAPTPGGVPMHREAGAARAPRARAAAFDVDAIALDVRSAALADALELAGEGDPLRAAIAGLARGAAPRDQDLARLLRRWRRHRERRLGALALSTRRAHGVVRSLLHATRHDRAGWAFFHGEDETRAAIQSIRILLRKIETFLETAPAAAVAQRVRAVADAAVAETIEEIADASKAATPEPYR